MLLLVLEFSHGCPMMLLQVHRIALLVILLQTYSTSWAAAARPNCLTFSNAVGCQHEPNPQQVIPVDLAAAQEAAVAAAPAVTVATLPGLETTPTAQDASSLSTAATVQPLAAATVPEETTAAVVAGLALAVPTDAVPVTVGVRTAAAVGECLT